MADIPVPARSIGIHVDEKEFLRAGIVTEQPFIPCGTHSQAFGTCVYGAGHFRWTNHQNREGVRWAGGHPLGDCVNYHTMVGTK